jgi:hypothetical protein
MKNGSMYSYMNPKLVLHASYEIILYFQPFWSERKDFGKRQLKIITKLNFFFHFRQLFLVLIMSHCEAHRM